MGSSTGVGFMAVFAVSGSVVLFALQVHKRLLSEFMKRVEIELSTGSVKNRQKKKVRFAEDVVEPSSNNKEYRKRYSSRCSPNINRDLTASNPPDQNVEGHMPLNRRALYKGITENRTLKGQTA